MVWPGFGLLVSPSIFRAMWIIRRGGYWAQLVVHKSRDITKYAVAAFQHKRSKWKRRDDVPPWNIRRARLLSVQDCKPTPSSLSDLVLYSYLLILTLHSFFSGRSLFRVR